MITFLFPFSEVGGVPALFYRVGSELQRRGRPVRCIGRNDGVLHSLLAESGAELVGLDSLTEDWIAKHVSADDVLVFTGWVPELRKFARVNPRCLLWNVFPLTLPYSNRVVCGWILHRRNRRLIELLTRRHGLMLMDDAPFEWLKRYGFGSPTELLVPIPVSSKKVPSEPIRTVKDSSFFNIAFIGRAVDWKLFPLLRVLEDVQRLRTSRRPRIFVVTDDERRVVDFLREQGWTSDLGLVVKVNLTLDGVGELLDSTIELNIGMGTSCLEGGALKIPTLLIDPASSRIDKPAVYRWLYETRNFNLGHFDQVPGANGGVELGPVVNRLCDDSSYEEVADHCYQYVCSHHDLDAVASIFEARADQTELTVAECVRLVYSYSRCYRLYREARAALRFMGRWRRP